MTPLLAIAIWLFGVFAATSLWFLAIWWFGFRRAQHRNEAVSAAREIHREHTS